MQSISSLGAATIRDLVEKFGNPYEAWCALQNRKNLTKILGIPSTKYRQIEKEATDERLRTIYKALKNWHIEYITYLDVLFPGHLQEIYNPPAVIFVRGNVSLLDDETMKIAMVGARKCSDYGRNVAIVSGGARGIDSHSHEGALAANGQVIVVMGCGLDIVYPPENKRLFDAVLKNNGLLVSEYPPGTPPSGVHFPARNRIISGLSQIIIVVEAKASSGSLITADMAANEGREIYVVPGSILSTVAEG
ncbi:DNA-processing protein DprA, partial [Veillonella infantium]|uniref:DNA-processing protein DprA n=1 Tax=Veillonella infantium TaxID=1911679 RepID=UPI0026EB435D